jgi:hypothetical protein
MSARNKRNEAHLKNHCDECAAIDSRESMRHGQRHCESTQPQAAAQINVTHHCSWCEHQSIRKGAPFLKDNCHSAVESDRVAWIVHRCGQGAHSGPDRTAIGRGWAKAGDDFLATGGS